MSGLRPVEEHLAAVLSLAGPLPARSVPTAEALGLVLAEPVVSALDLPGFDNSAMDGYAVCAADLAAAQRAGGPDESGGHVLLPVSTDLAAGVEPSVLVRGTAARIMTGAPVPDGADAVVPVEDTDGGTVDVRLPAQVVAGRHIRRRGEDVVAGQRVLEAGAVLTPARLALVAAAGVTTVSVRPRPRVSVLSTGNELRPLGAPLAPGQIVDSNGLMLAALVAAVGGVVVHRGHLPDETDAVRAAFTDPVGDPDVLVTSGGVSMGAHDTVKEVLRAFGEVEFVKVAMRPGMPQGAGRLPGGPVVVTLPGNPVSALVSFHVFVLPLLRMLAGRSTSLRRERAVAAERWPSVSGKTEFVRVRVDGGRATREHGQGSHMVGALAAGTALAVVPPAVTEVAAGDEVDVLVLLGEDAS